MTDLIYAQIAQFNFQIKFRESKHAYYRKKTIDNFSEKLKGFILSSKPKRVHYRITVQDVFPLPLVNRMEEFTINYFSLAFGVNPEKRQAFIQYYAGESTIDVMLLDILGNYLLPEKEGFFLHGSANSHKQNCIIFLGKSGAGKSTISSILHPMLTKRADDVLIVRKIQDQFYLFQTPFREKNWIFPRSKSAFKIERIFILRQSKKNQIGQELKKLNLFSIIFSQVIFGLKENATSTQLKLINEFANQQKTDTLLFNTDKKQLRSFFRHSIIKF